MQNVGGFCSAICIVSYCDRNRASSLVCLCMCMQTQTSPPVAVEEESWQAFPVSFPR